jgi:MFS family permease
MTSRKRDRVLSLVMATLFSFALSSLALVVPLLAVSVGFGAGEVGLLVALAAVTQIGTRLVMGPLMRRVPDKMLLTMSAILISLACVLVMFSTALLVFAASQLVQGAARALFWTSGQTHAVRSSSTSVKGLQRLNLAAGVGSLAGPACAGFLWGISPNMPLLVASVVGCAAVIPAVLLKRFPLFANTDSSESRNRRLWHLPGVRAACGMNVAAGAWRSILDSYIPVALALAGQPAAVIGLLLTLANGAMLAGSGASSWIRKRGIRASFVTGLLCTGLGLAATAPLAALTLAAAASLALSGLGAGILQTVGPAIAADEVGLEERGDALALTGTSRAVALLLAPTGMAGVVAFMPLAPSLILAGILITAPAMAALRPPEWRRRI